MRIKLTIAYDGTAYCGWQVQSRGPSIQSFVQKALEIPLRHPISLTGSGRTDAGVHALGQTAHFDTPVSPDLGKLLLSANALLPPDIRILGAEEVPADFHARYSATGKIYCYHLHLDGPTLPPKRLYCHPVFGPFDLAALRRGATELLGTHDFSAFANESDRGTASYDAVRTLKRIDAFAEDGGVRIEFEGDGFLYKMVRNLVGTLLEVAAGKRQPKDIAVLLQGKDRKKAGPAAPALGLFLVRVIYDNAAARLAKDST